MAVNVRDKRWIFEFLPVNRKRIHIASLLSLWLFVLGSVAFLCLKSDLN